MSLAPIITFAVYVIIAVFWTDETLLTAQAFTSVALISLLTTPVIVFIQTLPQVVQCTASFDRIQQFCNYRARTHSAGDSAAVDHHAGPALRLGDVTSKNTELGLTPAQGFYQTYLGQSFRRSMSRPPVLKALDIRIEAGRIMAIIGPVGSGKSTLLESMLGETIAEPTIRNRNPIPTAYCSQQPWLEHRTIRANIIGMSPLDEQWYGTVTDACGLTYDLEQMEKGDGTLIGSKGLNLSGGQQHRIVSVIVSIHGGCAPEG